MQFYGKAESAASRILAAFQEGSIPEAIAPVFIRRKDDIPCRAWSWNNQLLVALFGHNDARGYRQWQSVGRFVKKGERGFPILVPLTKTITERDDETGEEAKRSFLYGFKHSIVFGLRQTDGADVSTGDEATDNWLQSLPLRDVAESWGLTVETYNGRDGKPLGWYRGGQGIALGVENLSTWAHELVHAADDRLGRLSRFEEKWGKETVAELGGAILLTCLGKPHDADLGGAWRYIESWAASGKVTALDACMRMLKRTCEAVALILDTADELAERTVAA